MDSVINAFDPLTRALQGSIAINAGAGNTAGELVGHDVRKRRRHGGDANTLYFLDGINGETAGLFGAIAAVPEPETVALFAMGLTLIGWRRRSARR